jgi:outer membrane protein TolC
MRCLHSDQIATGGSQLMRHFRRIVPALCLSIAGCAAAKNSRQLEEQNAQSHLLVTKTVNASGTGRPSETNRSHAQVVGVPARFIGDAAVVPAGMSPAAQTAAANSAGNSPASGAPALPAPPANDASPGGLAPVASATSVNGPPLNSNPLADPDNPQVPAPAAVPAPSGEYPIDLATALRLADNQNPTIARARTYILEALAQQLTAQTLLVPSLNGGVSYHGHDGNLQRSSGKILNVSLQSLYVGAGAGVSGTSPPVVPGVNILCALTDAWFEPLAARQRVAVTQAGAQATANDILMDVAVLHLELLGNQAILDAQRLTESQVYEVVRVTREYAIAGEGRNADANRAIADWRRRRADVQRAEEELLVTVARLANRLNLDPSVRLKPIGGPLVAIDLVPIESSQPELIEVALQRRPDLAARSAAVGEAEYRKKQEIGRPFLPTLWLGYSGGVFGGGGNLTPPLLGRFAGRDDFDARVYWTLLNFGAGNMALVHDRDAQLGQAIADRARVLNRVREEVSASLADARAASNEITIRRNELASAELGFREDFERSYQNLGRPIEVLNSLDLLGDSRMNLIRAIVRYDQAQFRLWVALGSPPPLVATSSPSIDPPRTQ